jgi:lipopolysaccharide export system protein LptA
VQYFCIREKTLVLKTISGRQNLRILALFLVFSVFFTEISLVFALEVPSIDTQKFPIEIYGDYLEYRTKSEQVVTKGKSYISYKDMKISAENIQANTKTEDIFAQGNVDFWRGYDQTTGDFFAYNMKTGEGWMRDAQVKQNRNFFKAKDVYVSPRYSVAHEVMQTTCENFDHPHYRITADKIETYPGHSMTLENLRVKWKGKTLYRKGRDFSSLRKKEKFFHTKQGMSQIDGIYFKFSTDLMVNESLSGTFTSDFFEKRGNAFGFNGQWTTGERGNGSVYLYQLNETKRNHTNTQVNMNHSQRFAGGETLNTSINYTGDQYTGQAENQDLTVQLNYRPVLSFMTMNITANKFFDLDNDKYTLDDGYQLLNRLPEINFNFPAYTFPVAPLTLNFSGMYGKYEEGTLTDKKDTEKKDFRANFTVPTIQVHPRFDITPSYNLLKSYYSGGIERENGTTMVRANHRFSKVTNLEMNYNVSTSKGKSPFQFDSFTSTDVFSSRLRFSENSWSLNPINFNYNRVRQRLEQVYWDYSRRSRPDAYRNWEFFIRRDYIPEPVPFSRINLNSLRPGTTNAKYRMSTNLWSFDTSITYPHSYGRVTNTSFNYQANIRPYWQVTTSGNYNHLNKKFSPLTIGLVRDLHCWEARAEYNHERKEFWIEFYLKAYPNDSGRFRYGMDDNKLEAKLAAYDQLTQRYEGAQY